VKRLIIVLVACAIPFAAAHACKGFLKSHYVSGTNRICIYNHLGSDAAMTIGAAKICPITYYFKH